MAEKTFDFTKEDKELYTAKTTPMLVEVPEMNFLMVEGKGDPNDEAGEYSAAMEVLFGLSWTIKMSYKQGNAPEGFFAFKVPPLEGLWWLPGFVFEGEAIKDKAQFRWISMIRQPVFVTSEVLAWAEEDLLKRRPHLDFSRTKLATFNEGLCVQILHKGPYDDEPASIQRLDDFIAAHGLMPNISDAEDAFPVAPRHHELYLGDPRKTKPENLKTIIRHPVKHA